MFNLDKTTQYQTTQNPKSLNIKNAHQTIKYHNNECFVIDNDTHLARKRQCAAAPNEQ